MRKILFTFFIALILSASPSTAKVQSAQLTIDLPAGQNKSIRLKNLPEGSTVEVEAEGKGDFVISLINEQNSLSYPTVSHPLFQSNVRDKISFSVRIPKNGHYYVVFDNRSSSSIMNLNTTIQGATGSDAVMLQTNNKSKDQYEAVNKILDNIGKITWDTHYK